MNRLSWFSLILACGVLLAAAAGAADAFPDLRGPYLGQEKPGQVPQLFAVGIVSGKGHTHGVPAVSPDLTEIYWDERTTETSFHRIYRSQHVDGKWTAPEPMPFTEEYDGETPVLSPSGERLYFNSRRPTPDRPDSPRERIWYVERTEDSGWTAPKPASPRINSHLLHWQVSVDRQDDIYFGSERAGGYGQDDIFAFRSMDGDSGVVENLGNAINTELHESTPFVDPEGRYLLFVRRLHDKDCIFISRRTSEGAWGVAVSVTELHPQFYGTCPRVTPDDMYIFLNRYENRTANVYWVSAQILDDAKPGSME